MSDGGDLLDAVLVGRQVGLEGFVLLLQRLQFVEAALPEVLALQHLFLSAGPFFMGVGLVLEFLGQMLQALQAHHFRQKPFLEGFLCGFQTFPGVRDVLSEEIRLELRKCDRERDNVLTETILPSVGM